jgi:SAM-dependent methyltransferase
MIDAVDVNDEMLDLGRAWAAEEGLERIAFRHLDVTRELPVDAYDAVAALECLTIIPDLDGALTGLSGALRSGGRFVAHVPDASWRPVLPGSASEWPFAVRHGFRPEELAELLWQFERDGSPRREGRFEWPGWEESIRRMVELALD